MEDICETGPPSYISYPRRLENLTLQRQHFFLSYLKTLSDAQQPDTQPTEPPLQKSHVGTFITHNMRILFHKAHL